MRISVGLLALAVSSLTVSAAMAQTPAPASPRPVVETSCADYIALKETVKPQFIYYAVGHAANGKPEAVFDEGFVETVKPELDEYCRVNLTESAYKKAIASSVASERAARAGHGK